MMSPLAPHLKVKNTFLGFGTLSEDEACLSRNRASSCPPCMSFNLASSLSPVSSSDSQQDHPDSDEERRWCDLQDSDEDHPDSEEERRWSASTGATLLSSSAASSQDTPPLMRTLKRSPLSAVAKPWSSEELVNPASELSAPFLKKIQVVVRVAKFCLLFVTGERHVMESKAGSGNWWTLVAHVPSGAALDTKMALATVMEELQHTAAVTKGVSVLSLESLQLDMPTEHGFRVVLCGCGETPQHPPETAVVDVKVAMLSNCVYQ